MNAERYRRARAVFVRAIELGPGERAAFVDSECGNDQDLRSEVDSLLAAHAGESGFDSVARTARPPRDAPPLTVLRFPERIGGYRILGVLGEGGMGVVYEAEQENPRRTVALKVLHPGIGSPARIKRFEHEAQILGRLHHPGIAQVYEAGTADTGSGPQPFLAMELVEGKPLVEHAAAEGLGVRERIELLVQICRAAHHVHERGVIHRDLKPANILVDEHGTPKILDFGIARASPEDLKARTLVTGAGEILGTLPYMSPEQLGADPNDVDARADAYALGVIGYELLSGRLPIDLSGKSLPEAARAIREDEPALLGVRVRSLRGDVETIFAKALEKERGRRYGSALELAQDLERCLLEQPIGARPPSTMYQLAKFARRNRVLVGGAAAVLVTLSLGIVGTASQAARAGRERDAAVLSEQQAIQKANDVLSLSAIQDLKDLEDRADALWPADPEMVPKYEAWLSDARRLIEGQPSDSARGQKRRPSLAEHEAELAEIRRRARPLSPEQLEAYRRASPSYAEWVKARAQLAWMRRMLGEEPWPAEAEIVAEVAGETLPADAHGLNDIAGELVDVDPAKIVYGSEVRGLVLARLALAAAANDAERARVRDTLGWALYRCGRLDEALAEEQRAFDGAQGRWKVERGASLEQMQELVASWKPESGRSKQTAEASRLGARAAELERDVDERRTYEFEEGEDRWWHAQLSKLVSDLKSFTDAEAGGLFSSGTSEKHGWGIVKRADFARTILERSVDGAQAKELWDGAIAAIAASPKYRGLVLSPQVGLLPIGADPRSGLWEFAHLSTGEPAERGTDGKLILKEPTGLVLVLLPGGTFRMGAQSTDPKEPNYDPQALAFESPVHEVTLSPYFLSKYEMTQGQWERFTGRNPSQFGPANRFVGRQHGLLHPVEEVTWTECVEVMSRLGLSLPSEAQWESGCRGGTDTAWWTGADRESLRGNVNIADQTAKKEGGATWSDIEDWPDLEDGWILHAVVGSFPANPFGLHEVHGNVWEWCLDGYQDSFYGRSPKVDPVSPPEGAGDRVIRGGSYDYAAKDARVALRNVSPAEGRTNDLGLRPARSLRR